MSFQIALSGLDASRTDLEVTSNNIANSRTTGFKEARTEFGDVFATSINDSTSTAPGRGVRVNRIAQQFSQGTVDFTSRNLDLAINGDGFFVLEDDAGSLAYTRAGAFSADKDGFIVDHKGQKLQIYPAEVNSDGTTSFTTGVLTDLQLPLANSAPSATTLTTTAVNLDAADSIPTLAFNPADPDTYNYSTSATVYDSLGASHTLSLYYDKTGANSWDIQAYIDGDTANPITAGSAVLRSMTFDTSGNLATVGGVAATTSTVMTLGTYTTAMLGNGAADLNITLDLSDMTQYGGDFAVSNITQDGYATGRLSGLDIDAEGVAFARYTNGQATALGKVALAKFNSPQNLTKLGDTSWAESFASGQALLGEATTSSFGAIQSGALEQSNVDLAEQLVNLIVAQRSFQANSKVISSSDQILQTIIQI
jgi:flagellar hook protein FlgE